MDNLSAKSFFEIRRSARTGHILRARARVSSVSPPIQMSKSKDPVRSDELAAERDTSKAINDSKEVKEKPLSTEQRSARLRCSSGYTLDEVK